MRIFTPWRGLVLGGLAAIVLIALALVTYATTELSRFGRAEARRGTLIYAGPQVLRPGVHVGMADLAGLLARPGYQETRTSPAAPGQSRRGST